MKWLFLFLSTVGSYAGVTIAREALLSRTTDQEYYARMNRMPASNSVQRFNPPIFQYPYYEDPGTLTNLGQTRVFKLQLTTNGSFSSPLWDITTSNIFYNFLPSITNADGSTWSNTVSWRVIYMNSNQTVNLYTNPVHTFTMPASAEKWDRSCFADRTYLNTLSNLHPRILVKSTNLADYRTFVNDVSGYFGSVVTCPLTEFTNAITAIGETYWTNDLTVMSNYTYYLSIPVAIAKMGAAYWAMTNAWYTNNINNASPTVGQVLTNFCTIFEAHSYDRVSAYDGQVSETITGLALSYDYFWHLMTATERAFVLRLMENWAGYYIYEGWYYVGSATNLDRAYGTRNLALNLPSVAVQQESHQRHDRLGLALCLGGMGDSPKLDYYAEYFLSFWLGRYDGYDMSHEDPRVYGSLASFADWERFQPWPLACAMFYDKKLTNAPVYSQLISLLAFQSPIGYRSILQQWGPAANYTFSTTVNTLTTPGVGVLAHMQNRGDFWRVHKRAVDLTGTSPSGGQSYNWMINNSAWYWTTPTQADWATNSYIDAVRGWAIGMGVPPTDYGVDTNGVFFVFGARPTGEGTRGGGFTDGSIEIGAYGARVTSGGAGRYETAATFGNGLFVDGIGANNGSPRTPYPIHARFDAYTNTAGDGLYVRADLTHAMNLQTNLYADGTANMQSTLNGGAAVNYLQASNARPYITSVKRSVLFPHNKYFVIYDSLQTTQAAMFQWKWNVYPTNCTSVDTNTMSFNYSPTNDWATRSNITVYVQHIVNPGLMGVTQLVNAAENPVGTNEFCYAKMNPFTGEKYNYTNDWIGVGNDYQDPYWSNTIWVYNKTLATNWHFLSVVYPVKNGDAAPTITRIDDYTVKVVTADFTDTNTFDTNYQSAFTFMVDIGATNAPPSPPPPPPSAVTLARAGGKTKHSGTSLR